MAPIALALLLLSLLVILLYSGVDRSWWRATYIDRARKLACAAVVLAGLLVIAIAGLRCSGALAPVGLALILAGAAFANVWRRARD